VKTLIPGSWGCQRSRACAAFAKAGPGIFFRYDGEGGLLPQAQFIEQCLPALFLGNEPFGLDNGEHARAGDAP